MIVDRRDNVATALVSLGKGSLITFERDGAAQSLVLNDDIPFAHKFALVAIAAGGDVIKYGEVIGRATCLIRPGDHVHVHNVEGLRGRGDIS